LPVVTLTLVMALLAAEEDARGFASATPRPARRSLTALTRDVRGALRAEAIAESPDERRQAVLQLVHLANQLADHPQRGRSPLLARLHGKAVSRLRRIEKDLASEGERAGNVPQPGAPSAPARIPDVPGAVAAQVAGRGADRGPGPAAVNPPPAAVDFGPVLVDLVQRAISPGTWDVNGGPGTIIYYQPRRVLVVRAPGEVHGQVRRVAGGLRRAGF
jgi:hypothetical protein